MDWLNDKKNQPIIIGAFVLILIVAGFVVWKTNFSGSSGSSDSTVSNTPTSSTPMTSPAPGMSPTGAPMQAPGTVPAVPSAATPNPSPSVQPNPAGARPGAGMVAAAMPMETWRDDPFLPVGYKPPTRVVRPVPPIYDLPIPDLPKYHKTASGPTVEQIVQQPMRRMAGLLLSGRVYAILETNGTTEVVQPGDTLKDRLATVDRIERDKVILKTVDRVPRYITVRMAGASHVDTSTPSAPPTSGGGVPNGYPVGGTMPRGPMGGPGMMPRGP